MKTYDEKHIKNVVLLGAAKSGKTTLAETMMFEAGLISRRGSVEEGNTVSDYHEIEQERRQSVYATSLHTEWRDYKINLIDTPGLDDFIGETIAALRVCDTGVMLLHAHYGVEVGTELLWNYVDRFRKPVIFAINQLDHEKADFEKTLEQARSRFGAALVVMQYPLQTGPAFREIIDLLKMTLYRFPTNGGKPEKLPIPEQEVEKAKKLHNDLVEKAAEHDEQLMEIYFEKGELDEDELRKGLKIGMMKHEVFPLFCLSAAKDMGSGRLMGFIDNVAPSAVEMPPETGSDGTTQPCDPEGKPCLFVFKSLVEPHLGNLSLFKVMSGALSTGMDLENTQTRQTERLHQLFILDGKNRNAVNKLVAGDIGATLKLKGTLTNHTLAWKGSNLAIEPIHFPEPRLQVAVVAGNKAEDEKLGEVLHEMQREDPTLEVTYSSELHQLLVGAQGELQLQAMRWRLEHIYKMQVTFERPRIPYRETIQQPARAQYRHKKQSGGAGQFAEVHLLVEPWYEGYQPNKEFSIRGVEELTLDWGGKLLFYNCIVGGAIDTRFLPSILKGVMERMHNGPVTSSYVRDVVVYVYDGKMHDVDSNDAAFRTAGMMAFREAFMAARPRLMEPLLDLEVLSPEEQVGEVMGDLQTRRAQINGIETKGHYQQILARVPQAELDKYSTTLRSITQGRASFKSTFHGYGMVPGEIQKRLQDQHALAQEAEHA